MPDNRYIIHNDKDLREGIKKWFCAIKDDIQDTIFFEFDLVNDSKVERFTANGFNNLLIVICALKEIKPHTRIYVYLIPNNAISAISDKNGNDTIKDGLKNLLIFFESLNLVEMLLKIGVVVRPSDEVLKKLISVLNAKKEERKHIYSSKILCLSPLINDSQEQYNLTYRMKTLMNILYWQMRDNIEFREVEEASGQIMFELVKNIYQHSGINNELKINGFTCAQINAFPIIKFSEKENENNYTESLFLALSQKRQSFLLSKKNIGSFISITVNDFGVGIHKRVMERKECKSIKEALLLAFTTNFSSKLFDTKDEFWKIKSDTLGIQLEHKGYGLLYCLLFVFKNLGRIQICAGDIELKLFTKIDYWANNVESCNTPVDFLNLLNSTENGYTSIFELEENDLGCKGFVGTQILIEIPTDNIYVRG